MAEEWEKLIMTMREKVEWQSMEDDERVAAVLSYACRDDGVGRGVEKMWRKRFFDRSLTVPVPPTDNRLMHFLCFQCCMGCVHPSVLLHMVHLVIT